MNQKNYFTKEPEFFFVDMDGFLGPQSKGKSAECIPGVIERITQETNGYAIVTGRSIPYVKEYFDDSGMSPPEVIAGEQGGYIEFSDGKIIKYTNHGDILKKIRDDVHGLMSSTKDSIILPGEEEIPCVIEPGKELLTTISLDPKYNERLKNATPQEINEYTGKWGEYVKKIGDHFTHLIKRNGYAKNIYPVINADSVEFLPHGMDKGWSVTKLSEVLKNDLSKCFSGGDSSADIPMIRKTRYCGTVDNASQEVKGVVSKNGGIIAPFPHGNGFKYICNKMLSPNYGRD